ncbi:MAG: pyridoxamine 5'-phosphate oxidase family protein [Pseudomonadota bacterium]
MTTEREKLIDHLNSFNDAVLITGAGGAPQSRPMEVAAVDDDASVWFLVDTQTSVAEQLRGDSAVNLTFMDGQRRFLCITGDARTTSSIDAKKRLWKPTFAVWTDKEPSDEKLIALQVRPTEAEYWDHSKIDGLHIMYAIGKSMVSNDEPDFGPIKNEKIAP